MIQFRFISLNSEGFLIKQKKNFFHIPQIAMISQHSKTCSVLNSARSVPTSAWPPERNDNFMYVKGLELNGPGSLLAGAALTYRNILALQKSISFMYQLYTLI